MKVMLVDVNYQHSSTGRIVNELKNASLKAGHQATIAYGRGKPAKERNAFKFGYDIETVFHAGMTRITGITGYFSYFSTVRLIRRIKRFQPDVIHLHDLHGYYVNIGRLIRYLKTTSIKVIWTFHCEFMYTGKCANTLTCNKYESECHNCPLVHEYPKSLYFDFSRWMYYQKKHWFQGFDQLRSIVTVSEWLHFKVKRSFLSSFPSVVLHNGIDTSIFNPTNRDDSVFDEELRKRVVLLSVIGNLDDPNKGYERILTIAKTITNKRVAFVVVGSSRKVTNNTHNVFHFPRVKDPVRLANMYNAADYYLMVSEFESYPTVCLEASATGLPIIGYNVGGVQESIHGVESKLFDFNSDELSTYINLLTGKVKIRKLDEIELLDNIHMTNRYLNLYERVLNEK